MLGNTCHLVMGQVRASHLASYKGKLSEPLASGSFRPGLMLDKRGRRVYTACLVTGCLSRRRVDHNSARQPYRAGGTQPDPFPQTQPQDTA